MRRQGAILGVSLAAAVAFTGCRKPTTTGSAEIDVQAADSAGVRVVTLSGTVEALPEWNLSGTPLMEISGNAPPYLTSVGITAFLGDQRLLVYDRQSAELHAFASDGVEERLLGGAGDGPGEFRALVQLTVTVGDTIYAFDANHSSIAVFGAEGALLRTLPVDPDFAGLGTSAWALGSNRFLLYGFAPGEEGSQEDLPYRLVRNRVLQVVSEDGEEVVPPVRFPGEYTVRGAMGEVGSPFSNRPFVTVNAGRILQGSGETYELTLRDPELRPTSIIRWPGMRRSLTPALLATLRDPMGASLSDLRSVNPEAADQLMETLFDPAVLPELLPALGSALLDEEGRIWVSRFRPTEDLGVATTGGYEPWNQQDAWHVLAPDGTPIARVRLPDTSRLLAVRGDRVALVTRDSLGVETIRVLGIQTGDGGR